MSKLLYDENEWSFQQIENVYDACEEIALSELSLNLYRNQLEIISSEQMLDAYASNGMPMYYRHWGFGRQFIREERKYRKGLTGLAYEIVINSDPCINYLMEENSMTTQACVIAHAAFGHNHFFKNNYLFKQWTDASYIIDYLVYARNYVAECEEKYGLEIVEQFLDSCHALANHGINKYKRPQTLSLKDEEKKKQERAAYLEKHYNDLWSTIPQKPEKEEEENSQLENLNSNMLAQSEENILYFIENYSPVLESWQRELVRIVRKISQYFYPNYQTKTMNEGFACFVHFYIMNRLYDKKLINEGAMLEFLTLHTGVVLQRPYNSRYYNGLNPYYVGFEMFRDIKRICTDPTKDEFDLFPDIAGKGNWLETILKAVANYRDESFIRQFLSPTLMKKLGLFTLNNDDLKDKYLVTDIQNREGFRHIRDVLAKNYELINMFPDIQITDVNLKGNRTLSLTHYMTDNKHLNHSDARLVLSHLQKLWGYKVHLTSVDKDNKVSWSATGE